MNRDFIYGAAIGGAIVGIGLNIYYKHKLEKVINETVKVCFDEFEKMQANDISVDDVAEDEPEPSVYETEGYVKHEHCCVEENNIPAEYVSEDGDRLAEPTYKNLEEVDEEDEIKEEEYDDNDYLDYINEVSKYANDARKSVITADMVGNFPYTEIYSWMYYSNDSIVATEDNEIITDFDKYIPEDTLDILDKITGTPEQGVDVVYVVNHDEQCYIEIIRVTDPFDEVIQKEVN